jgi:hypothetical protein
MAKNQLKKSTDLGEEKKKRGRRPKFQNNGEGACQLDGNANYVVPTSRDVGNENSNVLSSASDDENVIVRLNISDESKALTSVNYDSEIENEEQPYPYNSHEYTTIQKVYEENGDVGEATPESEELPNRESTAAELKVVHLLKDFEEKNKNKEWPSNTSIACYWCCHKFNSVPFGLPVEYFKDATGNNEHFRVFGCFCSLECAAAYNFDSRKTQDEIWERYNLINFLSRQLGYKKLVKPAPDRMSLKHFGGFMDIEQFRQYCNTSKLIHINFPPMTSLTQQIEEINEYEVNSEIRYIPIDNDRINRYKEKIIFRRSKCTTQGKSILEHAMGMKIMA